VASWVRAHGPPAMSGTVASPSWITCRALRQAVLPYSTLIDKILGITRIATVSTGIWMPPRTNSTIGHQVKTLRAELLDRTLI
jgi:hypothetical protein